MSSDPMQSLMAHCAIAFMAAALLLACNGVQESSCEDTQWCLTGDGGNRTGDSGTTGGPARAAAAVMDPIVGVDEAARMRAEGTAMLLDARAPDAHDMVHARQAKSLDATFTRTDVDGVRAQAAPAEQLAELFSAAGVPPGEPVIVYGEASDLAAARLVWTLAYMGHTGARFLDGGFAEWQALGHPTDTGGTAPERTSFPSDRVDTRQRVDLDWMLEHLNDRQVVLIDARSAGEYADGHIPGALHLDWQQNVDDGVLRPRAELEARHAEVPKDATVVAYCQTGSRASMAWLTLVHLGYADARLYDGSMAEWTLDPTRPLE